MLAAAVALGVTIALHKGDVFGPPSRPRPELWRRPSAGAGAPLPVLYAEPGGVEVRGWLFRSAQEHRPYLLFFYGSNEDITIERTRMAWLATHLDVNAVVFDYRGYGFSGGAIDPGAMRQDALAAYDAVRAMAPSAPIIVFGYSVGAGFAIHVAAQRPAAGLVLQAPPASAEEMASASRLTDVPSLVRWAVRLKFDPQTAEVFQGAEEIRSVPQPLLIFGGDADRVVPPSQVQEVFAASPAQIKQLVVVPGAHHNDLRISVPPVTPALDSFVQRIAASQ